jgi:YHS domain-containing protein
MARASDAYPLTTCIVSGEKLGEMGPPIVINHQGTEVHFCCNGCVKKFNANPEKYLGKLGKQTTPQ